MNTKVFAIAFLALFALQGVTQAAKLAPPKQTKDLEADALAALQNLKNILEDAIAAATQELENLLASIKAESEKIIADGLAALQAEVDKVLAEIEALKQQAIELGQDIAECIGDQEDAIKELPITLGKELIQCVTDQVNEAISIVTDSLAIIEGTWAIVDGLEAEIHACNGNWICLGAVTLKITEAAIDLPIAITAEVVAVQNLLATIQTDMELCAIQKVALIVLQAGGILADIVECVNNMGK